MSFFRTALPVLASLLAFGAPLHAFPQDGLFFQGLTCPAEGFDTDDGRAASLSFPTLCVNETCCDLSNPINVRDMDQIFLYDGACESNDSEFSARLLVGDASIDGMVVVMENTAHTYVRCEP